MADKKKTGRCYLVGAGPGDLGLVTLRAKECIEQAEVIVYDYLCNPEMLQWAPERAEMIYAGKKAGAHTLTQEEINALLVEKARAGEAGRAAERAAIHSFSAAAGKKRRRWRAASLPFEVVPGVTSAIAGAGLRWNSGDASRETSHVTFFTGHEDPEKAESSIDFAALAKLGGTQVMLMGVERIEAIARQMMEQRRAPGSAGRAHSLGDDRPAGDVWGHSGEHRAARRGEEF